MKPEISAAIEELRLQFGEAAFTISDDGEGGARVIMEPISIGNFYCPTVTWFGFHIPAQYPYADIYPVFMGSEVVRVDCKPFVAPVTTGHAFEGRSAIQISRRNATAEAGSQKATAKILKVLDYMEQLI